MVSPKSAHLNRILTEQYGSATLQVVFLDVVGYSKRKSTTQRRVIEHFTQLLRSSLTEISKTYVDYAQNRGVNFSTDIIRIPTGDGAALCFSFDGLHTIALDFAIEFIRRLSENNSNNVCDRFSDAGWCNCHGSFKIKIGIAEGRGIVYEDVNGNANVAGTTINMAARVMGLADPMQIIFTEDAYRSLIDMTTDVSTESKFKEIEDVVIKHAERINIFMYADDAVPGLNTSLPDQLVFKRRVSDVLERSGFPSSGIDLSTNEGRQRAEEMLSVMESINKVMRNFGALRALADKVITPDHDVVGPQKQLKPKD